ncbi:IspD/TarI family cytidylyltransferase [Natronoglycomyces albus]|uniref:2-C-methyl-D-erythritol 4-phosphate cytidylyltransferase n=1 Tax=Natronoglycomyces albus TaxID=2811108 RepID=A0A895XTT8_9ACTN|nr:2-C-methyl-D-erythritol 4-phosphate cytidylyltransferase [Natronoglycomyces albus]QSB05058.1 2-C-methyl-D-erythritol 4-phosphate cytidylyltransferase [Natronoglycomyces albus]
MYSLVLLNGGIGQRVRAEAPKQFLRVDGRPIVVFSLVAADEVADIDEIILNYPHGWLEELRQLVSDFAIKTPIRYVQAGQTRHESVWEMLGHCRNENVILHESARPMVTAEDFRAIIADQRSNVSYMLPIPFTVAPVEPQTQSVTGYLERDRLRNVQLPQKFAKADLVSAHEQARRSGRTFTEDATLCAEAGHKVFYLEGSDSNIKVTTPLDVKLATYLLSSGGNDDE